MSESTVFPDPIPHDSSLPTPTEPSRDPTTVAELFNAYRYFGLPLPPKGSYLVKSVHIHASGIRNGVEFEAIERFEYFPNGIAGPTQKNKKHKRIEATPDVFKDLSDPPIDTFVNQTINTSEWLCFSPKHIILDGMKLRN